MRERFYPFDLARSLCVIYIIGIWHFNSYLNPSYAFGDSTLIVLHRVTEVILGAFTFLSGFFLAKYKFYSIHDIKHFFYNRFRRFFILLLISSLTYLFLSWINVVELLQILTGTLLFFDTKVSTLWYFSMLILFYVLTPLLQFKYKNRYISLGLATLIFLCFLFASCHYDSIDERLSLYFPCYFIGLKSPSFIVKWLRKYGIMLLSLGSCVCFFIIYQFTQMSVLKVFIVLTGITFLLSSCMQIYRKNMDLVISFLATSSMVAYLFHRQIFGAGKMLSEQITGDKYIPLFYAVLLLLLTFVISYFIQLLYNHLSNYLWK